VAAAPATSGAINRPTNAIRRTFCATFRTVSTDTTLESAKSSLRTEVTEHISSVQFSSRAVNMST